MKKLMMSLVVTGLLATSAVAAPELTDENQQALTDALLAQGYTVEEITVDGDNYTVKASMEDAGYILTVSETFEILDTQPAE